MDSVQARDFSAALLGAHVGGWKVDGTLGHGKSAVVLSATKNGSRGALKVFHRELVERFGRNVQLERIRRETSLVGVHHPNLVRILDGGECSETSNLFVAMEPIEGKSLRDALPQIPSAKIPQVISQVASAARFLEDRGLAHRDIKPENIVISDDFSTATLLDLGVVKPIGLSDLTDVDQRVFIGTLRYSSPEFLLRNEPDTVQGWRAVTFYQLGGVLHDLLMKVGLYQAYEEPFASLVQAIEDPNIKPEVFGEDSRCVSLCKRCLIKNPNVRLELVNWEDFALLNEPAGSSTAAEARDRIRKRQAAVQATKEPPSNSVREAEWMTQQAIKDASNQLELRCLSIVNVLNCFPLRETRSFVDSARKACLARIDFEADESLGLSTGFSIEIELVLADFNAGEPMYRALSAAALVPAEYGAVPLEPRTQFFVGRLTELLDSTSLEAQFTSALESAYEAFDNGLAVPLNRPRILELNRFAP